MSTVREFLSSKAGLAVCVVVAAIGVYLFWAHPGHTLSALPYLIFLACPLLHIFSHGHGHHHKTDDLPRSNKKMS
jgi:hypothetical protein